MKLEQSLVLNRYLQSLLGARDFSELKQVLTRIEQGPGAGGQSHFFDTLVGLKGLRLPPDRLRDYDSRVMAYEARLAKARGSFGFKYFQYLCLLYTEIFLDRLTENHAQVLRDLNGFLARLKDDEQALREIPAFTPENLRRLAFFMATGSGKTLLLHVNLWQALYYLERGREPEALVSRADRRRAFDTILLITPNEGLSRQHLNEFEQSGIDATLLVRDAVNQRTLGPQVKVIEIHKLAEDPSKEGVSILLDELGGMNLVFVDEGHKGAGSEAQTWETRQKRLSADGFLFEYSATFAQSIGTASRKVRQDLLGEYGKTILFDYSYRHFYEDGYGKDFQVLNLARAREERAHDLLLGGLLTYYQQVLLFREGAARYRPYNIDRPLWVFLGSSVNAVYSQQGRERSDVATVVAFLRRFLEDGGWAAKAIGEILKGKSGFLDGHSREDLFAARLPHLKSERSDELYRQVCEEVFHGRGGLEVWELKGADGELGLRVSSGAKELSPYFGVVNIGDVSTFKKHLAEKLGIETREDRLTGSLFAEIDTPDSRANVLIGSKKFIEGWSSWRVSAMGLLNIGKGQGPQVIQLFGRGVRLKGKKWTLKRSEMLPEEGPHPVGLTELETLFIFGWNANYIRAFREMLEQEEIGEEVPVPIRTLFDPLPNLLIPVPRSGYRVESETWTLAAESPGVSIDLTPEVTAVAGLKVDTARAGDQAQVDFRDPTLVGLLDVDALYADLVEYKAARGYGNAYLPRSQVLPILKSSTLYMEKGDLREPSMLQEGASRVLRTYLDRFITRKEREAEARQIELRPLVAKERMCPYRVRVSSNGLLKDIKALLRKPTELYNDGGKPLPRLRVERHLFSPLLLQPGGEDAKDILLSPPGLGAGETRLVEDLREFWRANHAAEPYRNVEVFLLRNLPRVGVGFFRRSGFYPDFILWVNDPSRKRASIRFLEPHGLHHRGLAGNRDKFEAFMELIKLSQTPPFKGKRISLSGYVVTETKLQEIPDAGGRSWEDLEREYPLLHQEGLYVQRLLKLEE